MRTVFLPVEVDADKVHAEYEEGSLQFVLPKVRMAERHTVKVA